MMAHEMLRLAADVVDAGWSSGANARDEAGRAVPLYQGDVRAAINPAAVRFSGYGAICKVISQHPQRGNGGIRAADWREVAQAAWDAGGRSAQPLAQFNDAEGRTAAEVSAVLRTAADRLEAGLLPKNGGAA